MGSSESESTLLLDLPAELIIKILSNLLVADLLSCGATNHFLQDILETSALLQYHIACHKYCAEDNAKCTLVPAMRLEELHCREKAWSDLEFHESTLHMEPASSTQGFGYDFCCGTLALSNVCESPTTITLANCSPKEIKISSLDLSWTQLGIACEVLDSKMSLEEHDLIAVVAAARSPNETNPNMRSLHIVLIKLSTGVYHPSALQPTILVAEEDTGVVECSISLQISGDTMVVLVAYEPLGDTNPYEDSLHMYNWKTGKLQAIMNAPTDTYRSFSFVSADIVIAPNMGKVSLDLFRVPSPCLSVTAPIALEAFLTLELPALLPDRYIDRMVCNASPHTSDCASGIPETRPHRSSFNNAIIVFHIDFLSHIAPLQLCSFVVHRRALLSRINVLDEISAANARTIPWNIWSPPTRWFNRNDGDSHSLPISHGQRYLQMSSNSRRPTLRVLDFNPHDIDTPGPQRSLIKDNSFHTRIAWRGVFHPVFAVFAVEVSMSLPFIVHESFDTHDYDLVLMDEQRVIGLYLNDGSSISIHALYFG